MKKYTHVASGRVAWAMRITEAVFIPDAARPESEGLVYDRATLVVTVFAPDTTDPRSTGGVGSWIVEVEPGEFRVMPDPEFNAAFHPAQRRPDVERDGG